jgi:Aegerolysin
MSENMQCHMNVQNATGGTLNLTNSNLDWGKWADNPPTQIGNGSAATFEAQGRKGSATGTQGQVTYTFPDNQTSFTINFDIPYSGANSGSLTMNGPGMSNYSAQETDSTYKNVVSFPSGGSSVTTYFAIGSVSGALKSPFDFAGAIRKRVGKPAQATPAIDIVQAGRAADCGEVSGPEMIKLFKGQNEATALDVLASAGISAGDRVSFATGQSLIPESLCYPSALDFAEHVVDVLKSDKIAYQLAQDTIAALRKAGSGDSPPLNKLLDELEDVKGVMLSQRLVAPLLPQVNAIESILACAYLGLDAALLAAGSCARDTATDEIGYETIANWQLQYLQGKLPHAKR